MLQQWLSFWLAIVVVAVLTEFNLPYVQLCAL